MTLATFLVLFTLMMARLQAGADPALHASSGTALVAKRSGGSTVSTRTSGGAAGAGATPAVATEGSGATTPAIVTRASGAGAREGVDD